MKRFQLFFLRFAIADCLLLIGTGLYLYFTREPNSGIIITCLFGLLGLVVFFLVYQEVKRPAPAWVYVTGRDCDGQFSPRVYDFPTIEEAQQFAQNCNESSDGLLFTATADSKEVADYMIENEIVKISI